jgi:hypothetical protein
MDARYSSERDASLLIVSLCDQDVEEEEDQAEEKKTNKKKNTGGPRYLLTFYLRIRLLTFEKIVQNDNCQVKNGLFICKFKIRGPK